MQLVDRPDRGVPVLPATDVPRAWWRITHGGWRVNLAVNHTDIRPDLLEAEVVFVGAEQGVFALDPATGEVLTAVTDTTYLSSFQRLQAGIILALSEDELLAFDPGGGLLWRTAFPDVIDDVVEHDGGLDVSAGGRTYHRSL